MTTVTRADFYNDFDDGACAWLGELMREGLIPTGRIDNRSIADVRADDLSGVRRAHFFAGIAGWAEALRLADWPDDVPVWTGSPPCQPFSAAGQRRGRDDARHLGPVFVDLVRAGRPPVLFGEQVASADAVGRAAKPGQRGAGTDPAWAWCDDLFLRLEAAGYAAWAGVVPAAGVGAPHIRQRLFFGAVDLRFAAGGVEHVAGDGRVEWRAGPDGRGAAGGCRAGGMGNGQCEGLEGQRGHGNRGGEPRRVSAVAARPVGAAGVPGGLADSDGWDARAERQQRGREHRQQPQDDGAGRLAHGCGERRQQDPRSPLGDEAQNGRAGWIRGGTDGNHFASGDGADSRPRPTNGFWGNADWILCRDERWRPVVAGIFPLAHGVPGRVGLLRGAGNAIVPQAAAAFIDASRETLIETGIWSRLGASA